MDPTTEALLLARLEAMHNTLTQISVTLTGLHEAQLAGLKEEEWSILQRATDKKMVNRHVEKLHRDIDQFNNQDN